MGPAATSVAWQRPGHPGPLVESFPRHGPSASPTWWAQVHAHGPWVVLTVHRQPPSACFGFSRAPVIPELWLPGNTLCSGPRWSQVNPWGPAPLKVSGSGPHTQGCPQTLMSGPWAVLTMASTLVLNAQTAHACAPFLSHQDPSSFRAPPLPTGLATEEWAGPQRAQGVWV